MWLRNVAWQGLESNLWKFAVHLVTNKRTYMTFLTIFLLMMPNATAKTIGLLTLVGEIVGFLFEVPSGYISDRIGHKNALVIARSALVLSTLMYVLADSIPWFFAGAALLAIGMAFESGTTDAFMHDTLTALKRNDQYASIIGKLRSIGFGVPIVFILLLAFVAETSFHTAFVVALVIDIVGLLATISLVKPPVEQYHVEEVGFQNITRTLREFISVGWLPFVVAGVFAAGIELGVTIGFKNPYQELLGFSIGMIGVFWALSRALIAILLPFNGWVHDRLSFKHFLILETLIIGIGFLGIGFVANMWAVGGLFIVTTVSVHGLTAARSQYYLQFIQHSRSKATLLSIKELLKKIVIGISGLGMGLLVSNVAFQNAYLIAGFSFVLLLVGIILFISKPRPAAGG